MRPDAAGGSKDERNDERDARPEQREPGEADGEVGREDTAIAPAAAQTPESRTILTGPSLRITRSPRSRTVAIVTANAETASAATLAEPPSSRLM